MRFYIPYSFEMCGMVPIEADSLEEAKKKAEVWLDECAKSDLMKYADLIESSEAVNEEFLAAMAAGKNPWVMELG